MTAAAFMPFSLSSALNFFSSGCFAKQPCTFMLNEIYDFSLNRQFPSINYMQILKSLFLHGCKMVAAIYFPVCKSSS